MSKPYPSYKDSGVEWLGKVPEHWTVARVKDVAQVVNGYPFDSKQFAVDGKYPLLRIRDLNNSSTEVRYTGDFPESVRVQTGELLIGMDGDFNVGEWRGDEPALLNQRMCCVRAARLEDNRLLRYALPAPLKAINDVTYSTTVKHLSSYQVEKMKIAVPPDFERLSIVAFLDHETAKIDALVEEQRRLIELLKEKRQAVISHAVTKGLNPNAPMKNSGIEWLGEVPEHWTVMPIRYSAKLESGHTPSRSRSDWWENCTVPWFSLADVWQIRRGHANYIYETKEKVSEIGLANSSARLLPKGTVMLSRTASVGYSAIMGVDMATTQDFANWVCCDDLKPEFLLFVFRGMTKEFDRLMMGSTHNTIYMPDIAMFRFARPPLDEQAEIVSFIRRQTAQIDDLIATAEKVVALSVERRTALISAAVTGKIDVRSSAEVISLPVDRARVRGLVATEIIERMTNIEVLRRVKFQKVAFLAQIHANIPELKGKFLREAAGPWDGEMVDEMEREAHAMSGIAIDQPRGDGTMVTYRTTKRTGRYRAELASFLGSARMRTLDKLITDLTYIGKEGAEAIATLYAVWNDDLMDGKTPSDDDIVYGFLNDWHPEKPKKFSDPSELHTWLDWMRRHDLTPAGTGAKTYRQLLV